MLEISLNEGKTVVLCTLIEKKGSGPRKKGAKMLVVGDGSTLGTIGGGEMERIVVKEALKAMNHGKPRTIAFALGVEPKCNAISIDSKCGGEVKVFLDVIKPNPRLIVVGSGHVGKPLADLAYLVGFEIILVDDAKTANVNRFPHVDKIYSGPFKEELKKIELRDIDFVAIVHGETEFELTALRAFLSKKPAYLGLLGSKNKAENYKMKLIEEGFPKDVVDNIISPIGLDIGAETPEEIAISIVAELIKTRRET